MATDVESQEFEQMDSEIAAWTAGSLLQEERQRQGFTEKQVADQLHITMHYVRAIEADNFEKLPGLIFARGYIKSYALLLGLDQDQLVNLFDTMTADQRQGTTAVMTGSRRGRRRNRALPWLFIALAAFLAGFFVFWIYTTFLSTSANAALPLTTPDFASTQNRLNPAIAGSMRGVVRRNREFGAPEDSSGSETASAGMSGQPAWAAVHVKPGLQLTEVTALGSDRLQISFRDEGWVAISDTNAVPIYRDVHVPGDRLELTGRAPFQILVGAASTTSIRLNDEEIDLKDSIRIDNTARLTVGI